MPNDSFADFLNSRAIRAGVASVVALLGLFLLVQTVGAVQNFGRPGAPATDTITVNAAGQATMAPDVARVTMTVENRAATVAAAQAETTRQANAAIDFVKGQGIAEKDIRTTSYNVYPQYSYPQPCPPNATICPAYTGNPRITGYQVSQSVEVTIRDLDKVSELLAGMGKLEVQNISGPAFALDDPTAGYDAARADAIEKAKQQAERLAKQLGVRLGKIVNFSESSGGYPPYPMMEQYGRGGASDASVKNVAPTVPPGENTYNASVSITYEIR